MLTSTKITLFALCMNFITINGFYLNNLRAIIFDVFRTPCGSKLYEVIHKREIIHNGEIIPVVIYQEVREKSKELIVERY